MSRAFLLVMDSLGIGAAPDAARYGDAGAHTLGHIAQWRMDQGRPLQVPHLEALGLGAAAHQASAQWFAGSIRRAGFEGAWAAAAEASLGKDTPSGHWEMAGLPVLFDWTYFPRTEPCFPADFMRDWLSACGLEGALGQCHASGTEIIERLGDQHLRTGWPIVYTSADSVFQVAAHEEHFGLDRLYRICQLAFDRLAPMRIGRVIARPFVGPSGQYRRTPRRKDIALPPHGDTLLDVAQRAGREVIALGKIGDIFAHRGMTQEVKAPDNAAMFDALMAQAHTAPAGSLVFTNFVDFDQNFGHRRDVAGYAEALESFDARLPEFLQALQPDDLCVITADHGCDPTRPGSDHTREYVPQLFFGPAAARLRRQGPDGDLGSRSTFSDLGQTLAAHLGLPALSHGVSLT